MIFISIFFLPFFYSNTYFLAYLKKKVYMTTSRTARGRASSLWYLKTDLFLVSLRNSDGKPTSVNHKAILSESCQKLETWNGIRGQIFGLPEPSGSILCYKLFLTKHQGRNTLHPTENISRRKERKATN